MNDKYTIMKRLILISIGLWLIFPLAVFSQESGQEFSENSIYCAEFDVVVAEFETVDASPIHICCGGPFSAGEIPCRILTKRSYESFSGASDERFVSADSGFCLVDVVELQKRKITKIKSVEITESSVALLGNNLRVAVKKGTYLLDDEGKIWLEIEYLK